MFNRTYDAETPSMKIYDELISNELSEETYTKIEISHNMFKNQSDGAVLFNDYFGRNNFEFTHNVLDGIEIFGLKSVYNGTVMNPNNYFTFNNNTLLNITGDGFVHEKGPGITINNSIFSNIIGNAINWNDGTITTTEELNVNFCLFNNNTDNWDFIGNTTHPLITQNNLIDINPLIDINYTPSWTATEKSPCINSGNPDMDGDGILWYEELLLLGNGNPLGDYEDRDRDMSRPDIGAIPYLPIDNNGEFTVENSVLELDKDGYNWICLPGIDELRASSYSQAEYVFGVQMYHYNTNGDRIDSLPFEEDSEILDEIFWSYDEPGQIGWDVQNNEWTSLTESIDTIKGYKLKLTEEAPDAVFLEFDGFRNGTSNNNSNNLNMKIFRPGINDNTKSTLVGYYLRDGQTIFEAIDEDILDQMAAIKTRYWSAINLSYLNTQQSGAKTTWISSYIGTNPPTLNYGEAVDFVCWAKHEPEDPTDTEPIGITWDSNGTGVNETVVELPVCFDYEEQKDYYPILCSFDMDEIGEGDKPIEIAVFVDNECKGAEVIKSNDVILKAYVVDDPSLLGEELSFQLAYSYKGDKKAIEKYAVMDRIEKKFIAKKLTTNDCNEGFAYISFKKEDLEQGLIPLYTSLVGNYPNPFNPTTTINYNISSESDVKLNIYNIRGQKVATLVNKHLKPGYHSVVWNGSDKNNKQVSSGVYFYRLKTNDKVLTKKMMLLK